MQIQELRIGNLVHFNGNHKHIGFVSELNTNLMRDFIHGCKTQQVALNGRIDILYDIENLKPIKITTEILILLGFEKCIGWDDMEFWREKDWQNKGGNFFELQEVNNGFEQPSEAFCEFVHQLQNSYYQHWLNGTELSTKNLLEKCKS